MKNTIAVILFSFFMLSGFAQKATTKTIAVKSDHPKLVIGIVIDQMRYDYIYRFADKYGTGGFKRLLNNGFDCSNTNYDYVPTYTGPGHAAIYTGTTPYYNGIIGNDWYDRDLGRSVYVAEDTTVTSVGTTSNAGKMSPRKLLTTTITDELRLSNNKKSKVIGVCLKDRGAIMPAGHIPSAAYWFDNKSGNWITSTYYAAELPQWVQQFNNKKLPDSYLSKPWNTLYPIEKYTVGLDNGSPYRNNYKGEEANRFPHNLPAIREKIGYELMRSSPFGNAFTVDFAIETMNQEKMGRGNFTDFLAVSFSCTDYVGHQFGINSIELQDTYARLDKDLERLFNYVDKSIGMDNVVIFLTADHGAAQTPEQMKDMGIPSGIFSAEKLKEKLNAFISSVYGEGNWVLEYNNQQFWLNNKTIDDKKINRSELIDKCLTFIMKMQGVQDVYNISEIGQWKAADPHAQKLINGVNLQRSGDIAIVLQPGWFDAEYASHGGTTHGSGYSYDTHVPLLWMGWNIKHGASAASVHTTDIAATLSDLLHIPYTNASVGTPLTDIIKR
jgi:predicted AlkP superfamily pyrophosphatase or phosphodiesterase